MSGRGKGQPSEFKVKSYLYLFYKRQRVQHEYPTMATMELKRTNAGNSEDSDTNTRQRLDTASTNRRLVPLTKGDINISAHM